MTDHPQEHESLDAFVAKVEASGEDKKHEAKPATRLDMAALNVGGYLNQYRKMRGRCQEVIHAVNEQHLYVDDLQELLDAANQRDAYAAEAVKQERERLLGAILAKAEQKGWAMRDDSSFEESVEEVVDEVRKESP